MLLCAATAAAQPAPPARMLVPRDLRPGEVAPDPGIAVPERIIPAPPGSGAAVPLPPASSDAAVVPPGGGDPGILAPAPEAKPPAPGLREPAPRSPAR